MDETGQMTVDEFRKTLLIWAEFRWREEVANRPLVNIHRRSLDETWRQVIRWAGGDPDALLGPDHTELLATRQVQIDHIHDCRDGWIECGPCDKHYDHWRLYLSDTPQPPESA